MCKRIYKDETTSEGEIPFYKIATLGKTPDSFITRKKFNEYKSKYPYPKKGSVLISASGTIGKTYVYNGEDAYYQDSNIVWLEHDESIVSNEYLSMILPYITFQSSEGATIKRLYGRDFDEIKIPVFRDQEMVINQISELETKINLEENNMSSITKMKTKILNKYLI